MPSPRLAGRFLVASLVSLVVAACSAAGAGHGSSPTSTPSPTASPRSTASPTRSPSPTSAQISYKTGATDLLLRYSLEGGFLTPAAVLIRPPIFSLYGDGTAIYLPRAASATASAQGQGQPLMTAHLSASQVQGLLAFALDNGHLATAHATYASPVVVADAPKTVFTIDAGSVSKQVSIEGLGIAAPTGPQAADLAAFQSLATRLGDFGAQVEAGRASNEGPYDPTAYRAYLLPGQSGVNQDWPWTDLSPSDFTVRDATGQRSYDLSPAQAALLVANPSAGAQVEVVAPDRTPYLIVLVPLLPDGS